MSAMLKPLHNERNARTFVKPNSPWLRKKHQTKRCFFFEKNKYSMPPKTVLDLQIEKKIELFYEQHQLVYPVQYKNEELYELDRKNKQYIKIKNTITKQEAIEKGLKFFFTGEECKNGHQAKRYTKGGVCVKCVNMNYVPVKERKAEQNTVKIPPKNSPKTQNPF